MHQFVRRPLGGQQLQRLRERREASDREIKERHLRRNVAPSVLLPEILQPVSRTVEAIVDERLQDREAPASARLRNRVAAARRGMQTERSDREGLRPAEKVRPFKQIAAVRRRGVAGETGGTGGQLQERRRMGKREAEWVEKQLQYCARAAVLEKECNAAWQSFFSGAGASMKSVYGVSTTEVNKLLDEMDTLRAQDAQKMKHQLKVLNGKTWGIQAKVEEIENGAQFLSELQERIDDMETALAKFQLLQREQFEGYVLEEKVLEKELASFQERMTGWESGSTPRLSRGGTSLGPRSTHVTRSPRLAGVQSDISRRPSKSNNEEEGEFIDDAAPSSEQKLKDDTTNEHGMVQQVRRLNDAILKSGGLKGGWDNFEHVTFTTLLIKCGLSDDVVLQHLFPDKSPSGPHDSHNKPNQMEQNSNGSSNVDFETRVARFLRKCMRKLVTQSETSVRSHFEWYLRHLELVEEKKRVIHEWKQRKDEERRQIIQCGFEADLNEVESFGNDKTQETSDACRTHARRPDAKSRSKTDRLLEQWKQEKKRKEKEQEQRKRELRKRREAMEAKRKQERIDAKQKLLLYKLQKEQEAMLLDRSARIQEGVGDDAPPPTPKEDLIERSRIAIEHAKAKRLRLQQIEERRQKQLQLPPRPDNNDDEESATNSFMVFNPTEASKARELSKEELIKKSRQRARQSAHDEYIPGKRAVPDVKVKSFGHVPIQPRAVPAWRKNI